jgi:hypothetical protein
MSALLVIPAEAGTHEHRASIMGRAVFMGPGLRRDDSRGTSPRQPLSECQP